MSNTETLEIKYFASCPQGLEDNLEQEIKDHGFINYSKKSGGVSFATSDEMQTLKFLMQTRIAGRIFKEIHSFQMQGKEDLYQNALNKMWHKIIKLDQTFKIDTLCDRTAKEKFKNTMILSLTLKDAIADQYTSAKGQRPDVDSKFPDIRLLQRIESNANPNKDLNAIIYLDLVGNNSLDHRGYRVSGHPAPLRENLAAGIVMNSDWDPSKDIFINPMCGTGTILIEAILIKGEIAPSYLKARAISERKESPYSFMQQLWFVQNKTLSTSFINYCQKISLATKESLDQLSSHQFYASDISNKSLDLLEQTLKKANIPLDVVEWEKENAIRYYPPVSPPGVLIYNPPYGKRLGEDENLEKLYYEVGETLKHNFKGFRAYILTANPELRKKIGLQTKSRHLLFNGGIECRLLKYELY